MKKLAFSITAAVVAFIVLVPATAWAQLQFDMTEEPTRETGGWVWWMQVGVVVLGLVLAFAILLGFLRWAPVWASKRGAAAKSPGGRAQAPELAPAIARPEPAMVAAQAAAASADAIGEKAHAVEDGAVPVADAHAADAPAGDGASASTSGGAEDVYKNTLDELLAKGVPPKVAEARAKVAAKKAGG